MSASRVNRTQGGNFAIPPVSTEGLMNTSAYHYDGKEMQASSTPLGESGPDADEPYTFKHAPPKPDGDAWEILLKPELEADAARCNAWKDEVQNLLIFAGLFSAVVTAFVIESYKFLRPDPTDTVIGLLFHIANSLNSTSSFPPSVGPALPSIITPSSKTPSSIRINVFWFISLILSLTTVLVGTISLQWLREHQSYPNFSPKEKLAILHMRSQALDAWFVPLIFSALPLLLQTALILFLAGLIDFSLPLGAELTIPISLVIFLTLLFLGTTTLLPAFQGLFFLFSPNYPWTTVPSPCPFKSPQSHALRTLSGYILRLFSYVFSQCYLPEDLNLNRKRWKDLPLHRHKLFPHIYTIWHQKNWLTFDWEWLYLRDACQQSILDNNPNLVEHREVWYTMKAFPLSDLTQCIVNAIKEIPTAKYMDSFLGATIHCFQELSASIWVDTLQYRDKLRQNDYFEQLYQQRSTCSISKLLLTRVYKIHGDSPESMITLQSYNQDQMFYFLNLIHGIHCSPKLRQYQQELWSQIISNAQIVPSIPTGYNSSPAIPTLLQWSTINSIIPKSSEGFSDQTFLAVANMLDAVFKLATSHHTSQNQSMDFLCTHSQMAVVVFWLANWTNDYSEWVQRIRNSSNASNQHHPQYQHVNAQYFSIFDFVARHLNVEHSLVSKQEDAPSVLFYLAAIFLWKLLYGRTGHKAQGRESNFDQGLRSLLDAVLQYRSWTQISSRKNDALEMRFKNEDYSLWKHKRRMVRFSDEWWDMLFEHGRNIELEAAAGQEPAPAETSATKSRLDPISGEATMQQNTSGVIVVSSSPPASPLAGSHSPALNTSNLDGDIVAHVAGPQHASLTRMFSNSDDHDENRRPHTIFDLPASLNHITVTNEAGIPNRNPPLRSSANPRAIRPPEDGYTAQKAALQDQSSILSSGKVDANPEPVTEGGTIVDEGHMQPSGPHVGLRGQQ